MTKDIDPREKAARALCRKAGNVEMAKFEGKPLWMSYLDEVDIVIAQFRETARPSPEIIKAACSATSINWPLSGEQVERLYNQVNAVAEKLSTAAK